MFKKPATLKPASPLRSSARRAFVAHLQALYPALEGAAPETIQAVVPVGLKQCGATTSGGHRAVIYTDDAGKPFWFEVGHDAGTALQQSQDKRKAKGPPAGASNGSKKSTKQVPQLAEVLPTIYTLWIMPNLLPRLPTWAQIVDPVLLSGSALMVPGLIPAPHTYPEALQHFARSSLVDGQGSEDGDNKTADSAAENGTAQTIEPTILSHDKPGKSNLVAITPYPSQIPLVLARLDMNIEDIINKRAASEKGKAATTLHALGDHLWEMGGKEKPPQDPVRNGESEDTITQTLKDLGIGEHSEQTAESATPDDDAGVEQKENGAGKSPFAVTEVDAILRLALLRAISLLAKEATSFPLPVSALYSTHVLPNRPGHWPPREPKGRRAARLPADLVVSEQQGETERPVGAETTDVRHSSAKKLAKWMKAAEKDELLKTKDVKSKDTVVTSVNAQHRDVKAIVPFQTLAQAELGSIAESSNGQPAAALQRSNAPPQKKTTVVIERFWRATSSGVQLFQEMGCSTSQPLSRPVIKAYVLEFINAKGLADPRNQSLVRLQDPLLVHALYPKASLNEIPPALRREEIVDRLLTISCLQYHRTSRLLPDNAARALLTNTRGDSSMSAVSDTQADAEAGETVGQMSKGAAQSIKIEVRTRQGRKVISLITSLEVYDIDADAFAGDLMRIAGAAASTSPLPGSTAKHPKHEVFIQGDQRKIALDMLENQHGVDRRFVQIDDLTKK